MLELLLKYDPDLYARGVLELLWPWWAYAAAVAGLAGLAALLGHPAGRPPDAGRASRYGLWALRTGLLALCLFLLLDPRLRVTVDEPVDGHLAVLIDDSLSMRIRDHDGAPRSAFIQNAFTPGSGSLSTRLEARADTRYFLFSGDVAALVPGERPAFSGTRSNLARALSRLAAGADAGSLAAVVVVTDGAGDDPAALDDAARTLKAAGIELYAVGVGAERYPRDIEIANARLPRRALRGDAVEAQVILTHRGLAGRRVTLVAEQESVIVSETPVDLPPDGTPAVARVPLRLDEAGTRRLVFRVAPEEGETVVENNSIQRVVEVRGEPVRILHVEGEPRFEVKFLRRAVAEDDGIHVVSLVRTAENKYYRIGVEDADELAGGLPETDEALFRYDAVVLGSTSGGLLTDVHQARLRDFVGLRGGGLVLLGSRRPDTADGVAGSTLAGLAPVVSAADGNGRRVRVPVRPTPAGLADPLLRLAPDGEPAPAWSSLPALTVEDPVRRAKPGATVLLQGIDHQGESLVVLAWQRYGRGTVAAFPVRDSWRWQMHGDVPLEDLTHERLWRNLLRHVARPAAGRVRLHVEPAEAVPGDTVSVRLEAFGTDYRQLDEPEASLMITGPGGAYEEIPFQRPTAEAGLPRASFVVRHVGRHHLRAALREPDGELMADAAVEVSGTGTELHGAELNAAVLARLAAGTGGAFFHADEAGALADTLETAVDIRRLERRLPLRDVPLLLALLLALACVEWAWRRRRGLP